MIPEDEWERSLVVVGKEAFLPAEWAAIPHGTLGGYSKSLCRCRDCRRAWAAYRQRRREIRRQTMRRVLATRYAS